MMKKYFIIFLFVFLSNAGNPLLDLGFFEVRVRLGDSFTQKYDPMEATDLTYSDNSLKIAEEILKDPAIVALIDPYLLDKFTPIKINTVLLSEPVSATNIEIAGISTVHIDDLEIRMNQGTSDSCRTDVSISIPLIEASAEVSSASKILFIRVPVSGNMTLVLHNLKASVIAQSRPVAIGSHETFQYDAVDVVATVDDVELQLNLKGLPTVLEKHLILELVKRHKEEVGKTIAKIIIEQINKRIARFSVQQLLDIAAGKTSYATVVDMAKVAIGPNPHRFGYF